MRRSEHATERNSTWDRRNSMCPRDVPSQSSVAGRQKLAEVRLAGARWDPKGTDVADRAVCQRGRKGGKQGRLTAEP